MSVTPGTRFGRHRVERIIGSGGMGVVCAAVDEHLDRRVALKVMAPHLAQDPAFRQRFLREASVLGHLDSPHIVQVHDHGETDGQLWIATQLVTGGDLATRLAEHGPLSTPAALRLCAQVAQALQVAHSSGIVHRDVKPENILLTGETEDDLHAYLTDFGVARQIGGDLTAVRSATGTWDYLAPECGRGEPATPASDVYAVGGLLWTCLTGRPPYDGTVAEVALAHARKPAPSLPRARAVNTVIATAMHKDPEQRYASAAQLAAALQEAADRPSGRRRGRLLLVAGAVAALAAVVTVVAVRSGDDSSPGNEPEAAPVDPTVTGDLDGDGLGDQMLTVHRDNDVQLAVATSDGSSLARAEVWATAPKDTFMMRGDVDGDDVQDVVGLSGRVDGRYRVTVFPSDGSARRTQPLLASRNATPLYAAMGDFDGDGDDDLAVTSNAFSSDPGRVWVAASDGTRFGDFERWYIGDEPLELGTSGDFDGDGDDDLAFVGSQTLQLLTSDGSQFTAADAEPQPRRIDSLAPGDFDGDGTDELVGLNEQRTALTVWSRVEGRWHPDERGSIGGTVAGSLPSGVADFDGDGRDDVLVVTGDYSRRTLEFRVSLSTGLDFAEQSTWVKHTRDPDDYFALLGQAAQ